MITLTVFLSLLLFLILAACNVSNHSDSPAVAVSSLAAVTFILFVSLVLYRNAYWPSHAEDEMRRLGISLTPPRISKFDKNSNCWRRSDDLSICTSLPRY